MVRKGSNQGFLGQNQWLLAINSLNNTLNDKEGIIYPRVMKHLWTAIDFSCLRKGYINYISTNFSFGFNKKFWEPYKMTGLDHSYNSWGPLTCLNLRLPLYVYGWFQVPHSTYCLTEKKTTSTLKEGCLKNTLLSPNKTINPHPTTLPKSNFTLLPELKNSSKINLDPIKDSALNIISLNIRSLTIKEDSVKLKRIFKLDAAIIVLTEVSVNGSAFSKLCRLWREQISRYQVWYTGTD